MSIMKRIADEKAKTWFIGGVLKEEAQTIKQLQSDAVDRYGLFEIGELKRMLQVHFSVDDSGTGKHLSLAYVSYMRFLDMKEVKGKRQGYEIYNRIIFGRLYRNMISKLHFGFTNEVKQSIINEHKIEL